MFGGLFHAKGLSLPSAPRISLLLFLKCTMEEPLGSVSAHWFALQLVFSPSVEVFAPMMVWFISKHDSFVRVAPSFPATPCAASKAHHSRRWWFPLLMLFLRGLVLMFVECVPLFLAFIFLNCLLVLGCQFIFTDEDLIYTVLLTGLCRHSPSETLPLSIKTHSD